MTEAEKRKRRCCCIGPFPEELKRPVDDVKVDLENAIRSAVAKGYNTFVTGMAYGVDIWAAEIVLRLRALHQDLHLVAVIPYPGFDEEWTEEWRTRYNRLLSLAEYVKVIGDQNCKGICQVRDKWMVDHSSMVIAVCSDGFDGTAGMIRYAMKCKVPVKRLTA